MFRNLATLILYIAVLTNTVYIPNHILLLYTFCMILGDGYKYFPKKIQTKIYPLWFFFERHGKIGYNIEFLTILFLSIFIFIKTLFQ